MKIFYKFFIVLIIYGLLAIPDNRISLHVPKNDLLVSAKWWGKFAQTLVKYRITNSTYQSYQYNKHRALLTSHLDDILLQLTEPDNPILDSVNYHINNLSALASLVPNKITEFEEDVSRWRKLLKYQSRYWDTSSKQSNDRLFKLMMGSRLAFESALIQSKLASTSLSIIDDELDSTPISNIQFKSGDIIAFNTLTENNKYTSFIKELPNAYKHLGTVYIKDTVAVVMYLDFTIGLTVTPIEGFIKETAPNGVLLRVRNDIPAILSNPSLPSMAAKRIYEMAQQGNFKYDHRFDTDSHNHFYDWELINYAYRQQNFLIDANELVGYSQSIHVGSHSAHVNAFEIEFDHRFMLAGEWYNSQFLYNDRILTAATASITKGKEKGDFLNPLFLPIYRLKKTYSLLIGLIGFTPPIPDGISAQTQLIYDALEKKQQKIMGQLQREITAYEKEQNHKATYLKMLQKADEITKNGR